MQASTAALYVAAQHMHSHFRGLRVADPVHAFKFNRDMRRSESEAEHARTMADLDQVLAKFRAHEDALQQRLHASRTLMHTLLGGALPAATAS